MYGVSEQMKYDIFNQRTGNGDTKQWGVQLLELSGDHLAWLALILGSTPPLAMVTPTMSLFSSSSFLGEGS